MPAKNDNEGAIVTLHRGETAPQPTEGGASHDLMLPLTELARRREDVAARAFNARWAPGRLVSIVHEGRMLGVLLDKNLAGDLWEGWMAASEADWAGAFDVLLEPEDEPFEPLFGVVQAWNPVAIRQSPHWLARVQGEVSATRLAAIRAVYDESIHGAPPAIEPAPGHIALRTVSGVFSVLSGTPLGGDDPRIDYQSLYRDAAARVSGAPRVAPQAAAAPQAVAASHTPPSVLAQAQPARPASHSSDADDDSAGMWTRIRRWFSADAFVRPAFAVLALVVVVQNVGLFSGNTLSEPEDVLFRGGAPVAEAGSPSVDLVVTWKSGVSVDESVRLLRSINADVVAGPDARGAWYLRVPDPAKSSATLDASPLVETVAPP
ncbi:hypothetical protein QTI66_34550 [Variovorax sp. J22R133]|uniref:hypothetical protein n=1 Tax=Variovorax brevis TaxID=3053503 RepID=UPI0025784C3F|nr:hypothetical protein [Variovorax sp. J22R133]MDM0117243.1 hypothetical protein [Variovorax sp. J22R133]